MNEDTMNINAIKEMLEQLTPKKNPQMDRNKAIHDLLAEKVQAAYHQGFDDGYNQGIMATPPVIAVPEGSANHPHYPYYNVTWTRPMRVPAPPSGWGDDAEYGCNCCGGSCNHRE